MDELRKNLLCMVLMVGRIGVYSILSKTVLRFTSKNKLKLFDILRILNSSRIKWTDVGDILNKLSLALYFKAVVFTLSLHCLYIVFT